MRANQDKNVCLPNKLYVIIVWNYHKQPSYIAWCGGCSAFFANGAFVIDDNVPAIHSVTGNAGAEALPYDNVIQVA